MQASVTGDDSMTFKFAARDRWAAALPTAFTVAWMWALPLLGVVAGAAPALEGAGTGFPLSFLIGKVLGYLSFSGPACALGPARWVRIGPAINLVAVFLLARLPALGTLDYPIVVLLLGGAMGLATAPVILAWATSLTGLPAGTRGLRVGTMLASASLFYAALLTLARFSQPAAYWVGALFLVYALLRGHGVEAASGNGEEVGPARARTEPIWAGSFWIPFFLLLLSFYSLAWMAHTLIFPAARSTSPLLSVIGALVYGGVALAVGAVSDRSGGAEEVAMIGLAALFGAYAISAAGVRLWSLVSLLLESSYGAIDLFAFAYLALWAGLLPHAGRVTVARGLASYTGVVALNYLISPLLAPDAPALSALPAALAVALALLLGNVAVLLLRRARALATGTPTPAAPADVAFEEERPLPKIENITPRETEVLGLILQGRNNADMAEELGISINTLKTHIRNLYAKARVSNRAELILKMNPPANGMPGQQR